MKNYLDLLEDIYKNGVDKVDRTSVGQSRSVFGRMLRWDLSNGFPLLTTRKIAFRIAFEETMFFLRGETNTKLLEEKKINIWTGNTTREFLDSRGLYHLPEGDMGKGYGFQMRHWESVHNGSVTHTDQIYDLLENLKRDPFSRRHVVTHWNPGQLNQVALPPCHLMHMYSIETLPESGKLNSCFIMRSNDVVYGLPYNIASYALLNHIFAKYTGLQPGELVYMGWDAHIYQNQLPLIPEQLSRSPRPLPVLKIHKDLNTLDDILNLQWTDIEIIGYDPYPDFSNKPAMAV